MRLARLALLSCLSLATAPTSFAAHRAPEAIAPNDNRIAAGKLQGGVLTIALEARNGQWLPEGTGSRPIAVAAFAEVGKPLTNPGPLIRVPQGTEVRATLKNSLDKPLSVFGFGKTRGFSDSVVIAPKATREVRFRADVPGTFYYGARRGIDPLGLRLPEDSQLNGAIVVDPANGPKVNDRVLVISWWFTLDLKGPTGIGRATMAINGLSWPHTERLDLVQNDSVHWRVINLTEADHPMHLHGFYFRTESKGNGVSDSLYDAAHRRMAVTEVINPFETMTLSWLPSRPGNWIYHCHYAAHLSEHAELDTDRGKVDEAAMAHHMSDRPHQMFGLVMGIRVAPKGPQTVASGQRRPIRITVREKAGVYGDAPGYAFVMAGTRDDANANALPVPGPTLVLKKGEPVAVTIVNRAKDRAAVHWHGIELESYPDGVPGWSGSGTEILPSIAPGDSLTVRFTPPRSGTFMYHSHFNELHQIDGGLYGAILVTDDGKAPDPAYDKVLMFATAGQAKNLVIGPFPPFAMNGKAQPEPMDLAAGKTYRLRLINIADHLPLFITVNEGSKPASWRPVAKDGMPLPAAQAVARPAVLVFDPGEIYDYELTPSKGASLSLSFGPPPPPPGAPAPPPDFPPPPKTITVPLRVK